MRRLGIGTKNLYLNSKTLCKLPKRLYKKHKRCLIVLKTLQKLPKRRYARPKTRVKRHKHLCFTYKSRVITPKKSYFKIKLNRKNIYSFEFRNVNFKEAIYNLYKI